MISMTTLRMLRLRFSDFRAYLATSRINVMLRALTSLLSKAKLLLSTAGLSLSMISQFRTLAILLVFRHLSLPFRPRLTILRTTSRPKKSRLLSYRARSVPLLISRPALLPSRARLVRSWPLLALDWPPLRAMLVLLAQISAPTALLLERCKLVSLVFRLKLPTYKLQSLPSRIREFFLITLSLTTQTLQSMILLVVLKPMQTTIC